MSLHWSTWDALRKSLHYSTCFICLVWNTAIYWQSHDLWPIYHHPAQLHIFQTCITLFSILVEIKTFSKKLRCIHEKLVQNYAPHILFHSDLSFQTTCQKVVQLCFMHLRTISKIKPILSHPDLEKVIHALIFSRLDCCYSLLSGIAQKTLSHLQRVQNAAAKLLGFSHHPCPRFPPLCLFQNWV